MINFIKKVIKNYKQKYYSSKVTDEYLTLLVLIQNSISLKDFIFVRNKIKLFEVKWAHLEQYISVQSLSKKLTRHYNHTLVNKRFTLKKLYDEKKKKETRNTHTREDMV